MPTDTQHPTETAMTVVKFSELLDLYGATFDAWPAETRALAEQLLQTSAEARRAWAEERRVSEMLSLWQAAPVSSELERAVAEIPLRAPRAPNAWQQRPSSWRLALAAVALAGMGVFCGTWDAAWTDGRFEQGALTAGSQAAADVEAMSTSEDEALLDELALAAGFDEEGEELP